MSQEPESPWQFFKSAVALSAPPLGTSITRSRDSWRVRRPFPVTDAGCDPTATEMIFDGSSPGDASPSSL